MRGIAARLCRLRAFRSLSEQELSWVLYDVGNSAFTMLACSLIPIWFKEVAIGPGQLTSDEATAYYSLAIALVTIIGAVTGPVCGVLADRKGRKKLLFTGSVALGVMGCLLNGFATVSRGLCGDKDLLRCLADHL